VDDVPGGRPGARARAGRYHVYREALPRDFAADGVGWADAPEQADDGLPVVPLFGSPSSRRGCGSTRTSTATSRAATARWPRRPRRASGASGLERFRALVDEAVDEGFTELYVTGGEPFVERDIVEMLVYASDRLDTVCLTNAMLFTGRRRRELERLAGRERLTLQSSVDGRAGRDARRAPRRRVVGQGDGGASRTPATSGCPCASR
jgi:hypothetical protein